jgi:hypothetical protein
MSFSREIKDFVSGYQSARKLKSDTDYYDAYTKNLSKAYEDDPFGLGTPYGAPLSSSGPVSRRPRMPRVKLSAIDTSATGDENQPTVTSDTEQPTAEAYTGGAIPMLHAEEGAPVEPIDEPDDSEPAEAVPTQSDTPTISPDAHAKIVTGAGRATEAAMKKFASDSKDTGGAIPTGKKSGINFNTSEGQASPDEIAAIDKTIDPDNRMPPNYKGAARLATAYQYFMDRGDVERAANVAQRIVLFDKMASMTRGRLAQHALQMGDVNSASTLIEDAYNENIPDGQKLSVTPNQNGTVNYNLTNNGKTVQNGTASPQDLWKIAAGVADGSEFVKSMANIASKYSTNAVRSGGSGSGTAKTAAATYTDALNTLAEAKQKLNSANSSESEDKEQMVSDAQKELDDAQKAVMDAGLAARGKTGVVPARNSIQKAINDTLKTTKGGYNPTPTTAPEGTPLPPANPDGPPKNEPSVLSKILSYLPSASVLGGATVSGQPKPQTSIALGGAFTNQAIPAQSTQTQQAAAPKTLGPADKRAALIAIQKGAPREAVIKKIKDAGYSTEGL